MNLLAKLTPANLLEHGFHWDHEPARWELISGGGMRVTVPSTVDYFQDPAGVMQKDDAPYLWTEANGDFVAQAHIQPTFTSMYDAGALLARQDAKHWAKLCFEKTDLNTTAAVSVVTRETSDDANGVNLSMPDLWLQIARAGDVFGMHYALDGQNWFMVRLFRLELPQTIQVGLVAQSPVGPGTRIDWLSFSLETKTLQNIRAGV